MTETNQSRASVALSQQEYTTLPVSNSRVLDSTRQEDRVITHELNHEEIADLLQEHKYSLSDIQDHDDHSVVISREDSIYAYITTVPSDFIVIPKKAYNFLTEGANGLGLSPMFIVGTSEGIYEFNLELLNLKWERYTSDDASFDDDIAEVHISAGNRILEWYPEFSSEEEYLDTLLDSSLNSLEDVPMWEEGDEW
jgi:hypothetical protein